MKRNQNLDLIRILAGILVICIHSSDSFVNYPTIFGGLSWWVANIVNSLARISVPLFIMISGSLLLPIPSNMSSSYFIKRRLNVILLPFIFWSFVYIAYDWILLGHTYTLTKIAQAYFFGSLGPLYFLLVIAGIYISAPIFSNIISKNNQKKLVGMISMSLVFGIILIIASRIINLHGIYPNSLTLFIPYIPFFLLGFLLKNKQISFFKGLLIYFSLGLINAVFNFFSMKLNTIQILGDYNFNVSQYFYEIVNPFVIVMTIIFFLSFNNLIISPKKENILKRLSSLVFGVYLIHPLIIEVLNKIFGFEITKLTSPLWFYLFLKIIIVCLMSFGIVIILEKVTLINKLIGTRKS